jgi:hypothetical protein
VLGNELESSLSVIASRKQEGHTAP